MILINDRVVGVIDEVSVANDKEVVRLEFRCKNQVTELLKLTDSTVFINYQNGSTKDRYAVSDLTQDGEYVNFSWTLGANATKKQGKTFFVVCAVITEDEDVQQEWNTELAFFNVNKGLECETQPSEDMEDLFAQLTAMVEENASDISDLEGSKQDKLTAGDNITIVDDVISATGGASVEVDEVTLTDDNGTLKVKTGGIGSAQIANGAVTFNKIGLGAVGTDKIANYAVTRSKLEADVQNTLTEVAGKQGVLTAGAGISISEQNVISATAGINIEVVQALPSTGDTQTIYLVPNSGSAPNIYDEYIYVNNAWEKIGTTEVDLSNYYTKTETNTLLNAKADASALASKLDTNQGSANVGKVMTVGADGSLTPQDASGGTTDYTDLTNKPSINSVALSGNKTGADLGLFDAPLIFTNVSATFTANSDADYSDYSYKAVLTCQGVTASMLATVIFSEEQATSGNYALTCATGTDSVTIYSNDNTAITVPSVIAGSPVEVEAEYNAKHNYSTNEQVIGTWIDGKLLYEKTIAIEFVSSELSANGFWYDKDLSNLLSNIDFYFIKHLITKVENANDDAESCNTVSVVTDMSYSQFIFLHKTNGTIYARATNANNSSPLNKTFFITINYTKNEAVTV